MYLSLYFYFTIHQAGLNAVNDIVNGGDSGSSEDSDEEEDLEEEKQSNEDQRKVKKSMYEEGEDGWTTVHCSKRK